MWLAVGSVEKALTERAKLDKARAALHPRIVLKGRVGSHRPRPEEKPE